ncbi:MAG: ABC transporter permease [bacterium]|nr:ABC transporter permease [bacterium]
MSIFTRQAWAQNLTAARVGIFLARRQIFRASYTTTALIIFVMTLTFLNLVVVSGILVGLLQGSINAYVKNYSGDILISNLPKKTYIENSQEIINTAKNLPWVDNLTARYIENGSVEAGYQTRTNFRDNPNTAGGQVVGIDPVAEAKTTNLPGQVVEGSYLTPDDTDSILLGANLLKKYLPIDAPGLSLLENVAVGDKVRLSIIGDETKEFTVKGIVRSKTDIDQRIFMLDSTLRPMIGRSDYNVDEVAIRLKPGTDLLLVKEALLKTGAGEYARVQTWEESLPKFLKDIQDTFALLGNIISSIGLAVASITIFIVIFINAITRRKFIGILKGIGIDHRAIQLAYIIQSLFYALFGTVLGVIIVFAVLKPFFAAHPINFPFSDGILVATVPGVIIRAFFLFLATLIAGYIPAKLVVRQNTLDAILGR